MWLILFWKSLPNHPNRSHCCFTLCRFSWLILACIAASLVSVANAKRWGHIMPTTVRVLTELSHKETNEKNPTWICAMYSYIHLREIKHTLQPQQPSEQDKFVRNASDVFLLWLATRGGLWQLANTATVKVAMNKSQRTAGYPDRWRTCYTCPSLPFGYSALWNTEVHVGVNPKIGVVKPPQIIHLFIGFSMKFSPSILGG